MNTYRSEALLRERLIPEQWADYCRGYAFNFRLPVSAYPAYVPAGIFRVFGHRRYSSVLQPDGLMRNIWFWLPGCEDTLAMIDPAANALALMTLVLGTKGLALADVCGGAASPDEFRAGKDTYGGRL